MAAAVAESMNYEELCLNFEQMELDVRITASGLVVQFIQDIRYIIILTFISSGCCYRRSLHTDACDLSFPKRHVS